MTNQKQNEYKKLQSLLMSGDSAGAEKEIRQFLETNKDDEIGLSFLGHSLLRQEKTDDAINVFERLVKKHPNSAPAQADLGFAYKQVGQADKAIKSFKTTVQLEPRYSEVWHILGNLLMEKGQKEEATNCFRKSIETDPFGGEIQKMHAAMSANNFAEAEKISASILGKHKSHPQALTVMVQLASQVEAYKDAAMMLHQGINYSPYNANFWYRLAGVLAMLGDHVGRIDAAQKTVDLQPDAVNSWVLLGTAYACSNQFEKALEAFEKAIDIDGENANAHLQRGHILKTFGRREESEQAYRISLKFNQINGAAFWALADLKNVKFTPEDLEAMNDHLQDDKYPAAQISQTAFALGKYYEDMKEFDTAFEYYKQGNDARPDVVFSSEKFNDHITKTAKTFTADVLCKQSSKPASPTPIFIVGLPRSGTTLLEQILASHSQVEGTCELVNLPLIMDDINKLGKSQNLNEIDHLLKLSEDELSRFGQKFLDDTAIYRTDKPYFIDKLPTNFRLVGLIHMILPNAKIVDIRRHPLDVGFSAYKQHFAGGHDFSYDLENIGHYYNGYLRLMDHWDQVLPGKVHRISYEDLVNNSEVEIRNLLEYCGLDFEDPCLSSHQNKRPITTPSSEQVRQPIHAKNVQYWRNFEKQLEPMITALGKETLVRF